MRSYIGSYKFLARVIPCYAEVLHPLEEACAGKESAVNISWTEELLTSFEKSKEQLKKVKPIVLPKRHEQLNIITDASIIDVLRLSVCNNQLASNISKNQRTRSTRRHW